MNRARNPVYGKLRSRGTLCPGGLPHVHGFALNLMPVDCDPRRALGATCELVIHSPRADWGRVMSENGREMPAGRRKESVV